MIRSFKSKALAEFFVTGKTRRLSVPNTKRLDQILRALNRAATPNEMNLPGFDFHGLAGRIKRYAVSASGNWRVTFGWIENDATDVDLEDYH